MIRLEDQKNQVIEKYNTFTSQFFSRETPYKVSMHFRLGDYVHLQHTHPITPFEYYYTCMTYITMNEHAIRDTETKKISIYYFCEDEWKEYVDTNYIKRLEENFGKSNNGVELLFIPVTSQSSSLDDWEQMLLMSCCDISIISNSTFSLWGAYFNSKFSENNQDSFDNSTYVYYPTKWFQDSVGHNVKNLFKSEKEGWKGVDIIL
jgi:hypothetical protein